jgi:hypothetical protein
MLLRASFTVALLAYTLLAHAMPPTQPESAQQLVTDVIYNELQDRACNSFWQYRSVREADGRDVVREQVETAEGPIYRILEDHGIPLDTTGRRQEELRIEDLIQSRPAMEKIEKRHLQSEERLGHVMELLPKAFLFRYEGPADGDRVRIAFTPDPSFTPSGYEARIVHAMSGTLLVNQRLKRMIEMDGRILQRVNFGYGLLGYVEPGGIFEIRRSQVSPRHWKTSLVEVHVRGRMLLFENVELEQRESRSDFLRVPQNISLQEAKHLLDTAAAETRPDLHAKLSEAGR